MSYEFLDFVEDILDAIDKAEALVEGVSFSQFENDFRTNIAVVRALEIIGEAAKRLPADLYLLSTSTHNSSPSVRRWIQPLRSVRSRV